MPRASRATILIAVSQQDSQLVFDVLGDEFNLLICHTFQEAEALLGKDIHLVACGVHFDQGRMFDLLQRVRNTPHLREIPFLLALGRGTKYSAAILQGIDSAARLLGATAFINMLELVDGLGKEEAYEDIRRTVRRLLHLSTLNQSINLQAKVDQNAADDDVPRAA